MRPGPLHRAGEAARPLRIIPGRVTARPPLRPVHPLPRPSHRSARVWRTSFMLCLRLMFHPPHKDEKQCRFFFSIERPVDPFSHSSKRVIRVDPARRGPTKNRGIRGEPIRVARRCRERDAVRNRAKDNDGKKYDRTYLHRETEHLATPRTGRRQPRQPGRPEARPARKECNIRYIKYESAAIRA